MNFYEEHTFAIQITKIHHDQLSHSYHYRKPKMPIEHSLSSLSLLFLKLPQQLQEWYPYKQEILHMLFSYHCSSQKMNRNRINLLVYLNLRHFKLRLFEDKDEL